MTQKELLVWLYVKLNTLSSSIEATFEVLKKNEKASQGCQMAALICFNSAIKYASLSMPEIERVINSLFAMTMTEQENQFLKSSIALKDSIKKTINKYQSLNITI